MRRKKKQFIGDFVRRLSGNQAGIAGREHFRQRPPARRDDGQAESHRFDQIHRLIFAEIMCRKTKYVGVAQGLFFFCAGNEAQNPDGRRIFRMIKQPFKIHFLDGIGKISRPRIISAAMVNFAPPVCGWRQQRLQGRRIILSPRVQLGQK